MWSTAERFTDLMFILGLNETTDQLSMGSSVHWYCHVLSREDDHILRWAIDFEVEGQMKEGRLKRAWKKQLEEGSVKVALRRKDALCQSS